MFLALTHAWPSWETFCGAVNVQKKWNYSIADVRRAIEHFWRLAAQRGLGTSHLTSGGSSAGAYLALVAAMIAPNEPASAPKPGTARQWPVLSRIWADI